MLVSEPLSCQLAFLLGAEKVRLPRVESPKTPLRTWTSTRVTNSSGSEEKKEKNINIPFAENFPFLENFPSELFVPFFLSGSSAASRQKKNDPAMEPSPVRKDETVNVRKDVIVRNDGVQNDSNVRNDPNVWNATDVRNDATVRNDTNVRNGVRNFSRVWNWEDLAEAADLAEMWEREDVRTEWTKRGGREGSSIPMEKTKKGEPILTITELVAVAQITLQRHFPRLSTILPSPSPSLPPSLHTICCVAAIAEVESSRLPLSLRYEPRREESSTGLMQVLQSTGEWLARDMGYTYYSVDWSSSLSLYPPFTALYFGCAYLDWLSTYGGRKRREEFMVRGYNGGPGGVEGEKTERYWEKYQVAKKIYIRFLETRLATLYPLPSPSPSPSPHPLPSPLLTPSQNPRADKKFHPLPAEEILSNFSSIRLSDPEKKPEKTEKKPEKIGKNTEKNFEKNIAPEILPVNKIKKVFGWTSWEEKTNFSDLEDLWNRRIVREQWEKTHEKPGFVRFSRDKNFRPFVTREELRGVVEIILDRCFRGKNIDVALVCGIGEAGSFRFVDSPLGVMSVSLSTATWLYSDLNFKSYSIFDESNLQRPFTSVYFGIAYIFWLSSYNNISRNEEFIVRAYHGGPTEFEKNEKTLFFYEAYKRAKLHYM